MIHIIYDVTFVLRNTTVENCVTRTRISETRDFAVICKFLAAQIDIVEGHKYVAHTVGVK